MERPALLDFLVNKVLFWIFAVLMFLELWVILFHGGIPNIRTAPAIRKKFIALLQADAAKRGLTSYKVVDLGAGHGLMTREIARAMPQAQAVGLEMAKASVAWANWHKKREKLTNVEFVQTDFFAYDFSAPDAFVMYQHPFLMPRIAKKLREEAKSGTLILCNKFALGEGWEPVETMRVKTLYFHQGEIFIYRKA